MDVLRGLCVQALEDTRLTFVLFTTSSPLSESLHMVMEDISCPYSLMKLMVYAEESKFLEETPDMTAALIRHVLLLLIISFFFRCI